MAGTSSYARVFPQDLMRELDDKEEVIKSVQEKAESLLLENHPARLTIEVEPTDACSILLMANRIIHLNFKTSFL